ncbi:MAG: CstA-like transporter-associated (seleno)protein [Steroidobacteraceae bacterium]
MLKRLKNWFVWLRQITGDDAYERYLQHHQHCHADESVLDRRAFYIAEQQRKWNGINRCC